MSNKVFTYTKITELKNASFFSDIAALPQLTMSAGMAKYIPQDMRVFRGNIMNFSLFQQYMFPNWNSMGQKFTYVTLLSRFLREKISDTNDKTRREWLYGCKKNIYSAINNIIRLEEARVRPEDIRDDDRDIILFVEMWKELERADNNILDFRNQMKEYENSDVFKEEVEKVFRFRGKNKIVWNGFHFFTPMQQFIFDCFSRSGYDIYALIQSEEQYPYANEIWNYLYDGHNGFPSKEKWIRQESELSRNPLGDIFEKGEPAKASNIKIIKYDNTAEFIGDIQRIKNEGYYFYCADDHTANSILKDYFPENYEVRNLLSYPIGQFIYTLHRMWDENLQCIVLDADGLRKCFASGWLSAGGHSSIQYTDDLERLLPYFEGCYTVDQWNERLGSFIDAYDNAIDVFAIKKTGDQKKDRNRELYGDPFKKFGVYSIKENRIDDVISIISQLIKMAKSLFGANEPISIHEHMSKLEAMIYIPEGFSKDLYQEEKKIAEQIFKVLESDRIKDFLCYPGDLATALISFMGNKIEEEDKKDIDKTIVFNIFHVDSAPISAKGKVHICLADITKLPGAVGTYAWPLDEDILKRVVEKRKDTNLSKWINNNYLTALSNRYYIYSALKNNNVEISWIEKQGEKLFSPSPYVTLLDKLSDIQIVNYNNRKVDLQAVSQVPAQKRVENDYNIRDHQDHHSYDSELEYSICPMRFIYSNVLSDGFSYKSEYQQNRAVVRLIQILKKILGNKYTIEQVSEQVFELFPSIRKAERRQMIDDAIRWRLPEHEEQYTTYDDYDYTNERLNLEFLDEGIYAEGKKNASMLMSQEGRKGIFYKRHGDTGSHNCEFCPHTSYCMESLFGLDYKMGD
ncbi:hypothetical protein [Butyrivibrio sp. MC2013]|uniref:hypothetical protein n=1 Tax=Butyrivibrio sp. MC2013 TaxID=1280686 RepID=UPI0004177705|nr:hypothetical protein [Butyrivibrio sp. MC2013]